MSITLAPMEGVADHHIRHLLSAQGGIDRCVTEFVRVTHTKLPARVFKQAMPELLNGGVTPSGVPVKLQLLGSHIDMMARNAAHAIKHGAEAIDLNFGCPAKTVNNSDGGACLLREPERVNRIVSAVRAAVPADIPVTAKMRLGFDDKSLYLDNAHAIASAGASELAVHARSKTDGYRPPAYWDYIAHIREALQIPVIANGEIWSVADYQRCKEITGCQHFMIGRGLMAHPDLAATIKAYEAQVEYTPRNWHHILELLLTFYQDTLPHYPRKFSGNRLKQWLVYLKLHYTEAQDFFDQLKRYKAPEDIERLFEQALQHYPH